MFDSIRDIQDFSKSSNGLNLGEIKKSSYVSKVLSSKKGDILIKINRSKKISCGIAHKIAGQLKLSNPDIQIKLDDALLDMDDDNELIFKSKNPLWVLKTVGSDLVLSRVF